MRISPFVVCGLAVLLVITVVVAIFALQNPRLAAICGSVIGVALVAATWTLYGNREVRMPIKVARWFSSWNVFKNPPTGDDAAALAHNLAVVHEHPFNVNACSPELLNAYHQRRPSNARPITPDDRILALVMRMTPPYDIYKCDPAYVENFLNDTHNAAYIEMLACQPDLEMIRCAYQLTEYLEHYDPLAKSGIAGQPTRADIALINTIRKAIHARPTHMEPFNMDELSGIMLMKIRFKNAMVIKVLEPIDKRARSLLLRRADEFYNIYTQLFRSIPGSFHIPDMFGLATPNEVRLTTNDPPIMEITRVGGADIRTALSRALFFAEPLRLEENVALPVAKHAIQVDRSLVGRSVLDVIEQLGRSI